MKLIHFVFYFYYKPSTVYFKDRPASVFLGIACALFTFMLTGFLLSMLVIRGLDLVYSAQWLVSLQVILCLIILYFFIHKNHYRQIIKVIDGESDQEKKNRVAFMGVFFLANVFLFYTVFSLVQ